MGLTVYEAKTKAGMLQQIYLFLQQNSFSRNSFRKVGETSDK